MSYSGQNGGKAESGIWLTEDGNTWTKRYTANSSFMVEDIIFVNDKTGWSIETKNSNFYKDRELHKTTNGGKNWEAQITPNIPRIYSMYFLNTEIGYIGACGCIFKTSNGGINWNKTDIESESFVRENYVTGLFFYNSDYGWGCSNEGNIFKTTNGGESWQTIFTKYRKELVRTFFINEKTGWVVGKSGIIAKSTDGGNIWVKQVLPNNVYDLKDILFIDENTGWCVGEAGTLLKTTNGGNKWEIEDPTPGNSYRYNSITKNNNNKIFIACDKGGLLTLDLANH